MKREDLRKHMKAVRREAVQKSEAMCATQREQELAPKVPCSQHA